MLLIALPGLYHPYLLQILSLWEKVALLPFFLLLRLFVDYL